MLRVRDIMTTDLITLDPNLTIREAMELFAAERITGAPVMGGTKVIGVVSATDLMQFAASMPGVPTERDLADDLLEEEAKGGGDDEPRVPHSVDDPRGVYFTELWEDAGATVSERMAVPSGAEWNSLEEHTVSEAMTPAPIHALTPDTLVTVAADYLRRTEIHRVLIMAGDDLLGVVTTSDITDAVADGKLTSHTHVFDRGSKPARIHSTWSGRR
jgi:CBS domain-containing protein